MELYSKKTFPDFSGITDPMERLVTLSRHYGKDPRFVIAGGGNTSVKVGDRLFVKASGIALANADADGFVEMYRDPLDELADTLDLGEEEKAREERFKQAVLAARVEPEKGQRPSVECLLHNLLPSAFVVHTHCTVINTITCALDGEALTREVFGDDVIWVPYVTPGFVLSKTLYDALQAFTERTGRRYPDAVMMGNHGLIICGETPEEIAKWTEKVCAKALEHVGPLAADAYGALSSIDANTAAARAGAIQEALGPLLGPPEAPREILFDDAPILQALCGGADGKAMATAGPLTPDQIVYCKSFPLWFQAEAGESAQVISAHLAGQISAYKDEHGHAPYVVLAAGLGMFTAGDTASAAETARDIYTDIMLVMAGARKLGGVKYMTIEEREFIENWEVEHYRRQVAAGVL